MAYNPFAPKQEEKVRAEKLSGFFKGNRPKTDDLYSGSAILDPVRGLAEFGQQMVADNIKFAGAVLDWSGDRQGGEQARDIAGKIEFEKTRGWEAKGRGVHEYPLYHPRKLLRMSGGVAGSVLSTFGGGGIATKLLMKAGLGGKLAREIGFTLASIPLSTAAAGDFYEEITRPLEEGGGGKTPEEAMLLTMSLGIGMGVLERAVPLTWWMSKKTGGARLVSTIFQETGEEGAQQLWTNAHKVIGWKGTKDLYHKMMDDMAESLVGGVMGGTMAGSVDISKPRVPKIEVSPETTQQVFEMMSARGVKNANDEPVTLEDVASMMKVGVNKIYKEENSIMKRLFKTRGMIPNIDAMLQAREDETAYEQATIETDPKTGENVIKMHPKGDTSKKYGPVLGKMVDEAAKSGKTLSKAEIQSILDAEKVRKRTVTESYEKMQYIAGGEHIAFSKLPVALQTIIENEGPANAVELKDFIDDKMNDPNVLYYMGGEADSERAEIFYGPLMQNRRQGWRDGKWTKGQVSPYAWIRDFAAYMAIEGIAPSSVTVIGDENTEDALKTLLDKYSEVNIGVPAQVMATRSAEDLKTRKGFEKTDEGKTASQVEFSFNYDAMKLTQAKIDRKITDEGLTKLEATLNVNHEDNMEVLNSIPHKEKLKSDEGKMFDKAGIHWHNYDSPAAFVENMKGVMDNIWRAVKAQEPARSKANDMIMQVIRERAYINIVGMPLTSTADAIEVASLFRNPSVEVSQVVFVKDGLIISHSAHSVNSPRNGTVSQVMIENTIRETQADGFYLVHNHPSGNPELSDADVSTALEYKMLNEGRSIETTYSVIQGKYLGLASTDGEKYNFIDANVSEESYRTYIDTDMTARPRLRTQNGEIANFQQKYKTGQINFGSGEHVFDAASTIIMDANSNFHKGKTTLLVGDTEFKMLNVEYLQDGKVISEEVTRLLMANKGSTYVIISDGTTLKQIDFENMPDGIQDVLVSEKIGTYASVKEHKSAKWKSYKKKLENPYAIPANLPAQALINETEDSILGEQLNLEHDKRVAQQRQIDAFAKKQQEDQDMIELFGGVEADISDDPYANVPPITKEKLDTMNNAFDNTTRENLWKAFKHAYDTNDIDMTRMLEENLDAYMEESEEGISRRSEKEAQDEFTRTGESQIIDALKDSYSKARSIAAGAGRRASTLRKTIKTLETIKTMNPTETKEVNQSIRTRKKALAQIEMVRKAASAEVKQERIQRVRDSQANATSIQITNSLTVTDLQTKDSFTLPPGSYELIRYADNPQAVKIQGLGYQVDVNANTMTKWAASDVKFISGEDERKLDNGLAAEIRDQPHAGQANPFDGEPIVEREAPTPAARRFSWKLRTFLRVGKFLGADEEDIIKSISRYNKQALKTDPKTGAVTGGAWTVLEDPTDQKVLQDVVDQALTERNYAGFAEMVGRIAEDIVVQQVNDYVTKSMPHLDGVDKQDAVRAWLKIMNDMAEEVIVVGQDASKYVYSNKGYTHYFKDGQIPGKLDSEKTSNIKRYKELHQLLKGGDPDPAIISMMEGDQYRRGMRPEALYWSLAPKEIQNIVLWQKANVEDPMFFKLLNSDVLSRAPNLQNRLNGFSHHAWRYDPDTAQDKAKGKKDVVGSQRQPPRGREVLI